MKCTSVSVGALDYDVAVHRGSERNAPLFVYINARGNAAMGSYVYTIGRGRETYASVLQHSDALLHDMAANLGHVLLARLACPSYVLLSGQVPMHDYGELAHAVVSQCM